MSIEHCHWSFWACFILGQWQCIGRICVAPNNFQRSLTNDSPKVSELFKKCRIDLKQKDINQQDLLVFSSKSWNLVLDSFLLLRSITSQAASISTLQSMSKILGKTSNDEKNSTRKTWKKWKTHTELAHSVPIPNDSWTILIGSPWTLVAINVLFLTCPISFVRWNKKKILRSCCTSSNLLFLSPPPYLIYFESSAA